MEAQFQPNVVFVFLLTHPTALKQGLSFYLAKNPMPPSNSCWPRSGERGWSLCDSDLYVALRTCMYPISLPPEANIGQVLLCQKCTSPWPCDDGQREVTQDCSPPLSSVQVQIGTSSSEMGLKVRWSC
jgi:hypothetical protein